MTRYGVIKLFFLSKSLMTPPIDSLVKIYKQNFTVWIVWLVIGLSGTLLPLAWALKMTMFLAGNLFLAQHNNPPIAEGIKFAIQISTLFYFLTQPF